MSFDTNAFGQKVGLPVSDWKPAALPTMAALVGRFCTVERLDVMRHAADLFAANSRDDGRMWTYLAYGPFATLDDYRAWATDAAKLTDPIYYAIVERASGKAIGVASYLRIDAAMGSIEVGHIAYSPLLQRNTAATEAMYLMMANVFALGYRRYEWKCNSLNAPSMSAAKRLGFTYEGTFRQARVDKGRNRDTAWFAVIDKDWPVLQSAYKKWLDPANFDAAGRQRVSLSQLTAREDADTKLD